MVDLFGKTVKHFFFLIFFLLQGCDSPFQVKQDYSPQLVVYGIAFRGDSSLVIRVETNSRTPVTDSTVSNQISGLSGTLLNQTTGTSVQLSSSFINNVNLLQSNVKIDPKTKFLLQVSANGYSPCSSSLIVLDSGIIYPTYWTTSVLRDPSVGLQDPDFTIYVSPLAAAIRVTMSVRYQGISPKGEPVSGEISVNPAYQQDTTSYFLRVNGQTTDVTFLTADYVKEFVEATGAIKSGTITAVIKLFQIDAALYDYYSIANGFNDPLTMRTEKPVYTNITGGLGFFGSASYDSLSVQVYP